MKMLRGILDPGNINVWGFWSGFFFLERLLPRVTGSDLILHAIDPLLLKGLSLT